MKTKQIETTRLVIRDFIVEDAPDLYAILGDAETMQYSEPAYDLAKTREFLQTFCIGRKGAMAAVHKQSGKLIGYLLFHQLTPGIYEMGWFFNRTYWRQGYAYEACIALLDYAFKELNAKKVFAETIDTTKAVGLMKKLGMTQEGIQQSQAMDNDGRWADLHLYRLLQEDWQHKFNSGFYEN